MSGATGAASSGQAPRAEAVPMERQRQPIDPSVDPPPAVGSEAVSGADASSAGLESTYRPHLYPQGYPQGVEAARWSWLWSWLSPSPSSTPVHLPDYWIPPQRVGISRTSLVLVSVLGTGVLLLALAAGIVTSFQLERLGVGVSTPRTTHAPATTAASPEDVVPPGIAVAILGRQETLARIAAWYGISEEALVLANRDRLARPPVSYHEVRLIIPALYRPGVPPSAQPRPLYYVVQPGDNLSSLGQRFGIDWKTLASYNQLSNADQLAVGEGMVIPPSPPSAP